MCDEKGVDSSDAVTRKPSKCSWIEGFTGIYEEVLALDSEETRCIVSGVLGKRRSAGCTCWIWIREAANNGNTSAGAWLIELS